MSYAELHCLSNFSFQRGASSARELFERAKLHGYRRCHGISALDTFFFFPT